MNCFENIDINNGFCFMKKRGILYNIFFIENRILSHLTSKYFYVIICFKYALNFWYIFSVFHKILH